MGRPITPKLDQSRSTHPEPRVVNPALRGEHGSVVSAPQPLPAGAASRAQKPSRPQVPVPDADAPAAENMPVPPANAAKVPKPVTEE